MVQPPKDKNDGNQERDKDRRIKKHGTQSGWCSSVLSSLAVIERVPGVLEDSGVREKAAIR